ncbi:T9SS type A sorting domain-containing protein [Polaribacter gochangensis]
MTSEAMSQNITIGNSNLPSGIYILKIVSKEETITTKLIVSQE